MNANFQIFNRDGAELLPTSEQAPIHLKRKLSMKDVFGDTSLSWSYSFESFLTIILTFEEKELFAAATYQGSEEDVSIIFLNNRAGKNCSFGLINGWYLESLDKEGNATIKINEPENIVFYVFGIGDIKPMPDGQGCGLEIYSTTGHVLLSSAYPPMNAVEKYEGNYWGGRKNRPNGQSKTFLVPETRKWAVICTCSIQYEAYQYNGAECEFWGTGSAATFNKQTIVLGEKTALYGEFYDSEYSLANTAFFWQKAWRFLIVDVTGM